MPTKSILNSIACLFLYTSAASASPEALENARSTIGEWVATEKAISLETVEWEAEKVLLRDLIDVARTRINGLEATLAETKSSVSASEEKREELVRQRAVIADKANRIRIFLTAIETDLREMKALLPDPLQAELAPLYQRLPADPAKTNAGLGERMQTVVGLLTGIRQFDGKITLSETTQTLPGREIKGAFQTLWLGLGQAYYLAPDDAGFGTPGSEGWEWQSRPEFEGPIREAMALVEGTASEPKMIDLPIGLREGAAR